MALGRRYDPSWPPGESAWVGMDFSMLLPPGVTITSVDLQIVTNTSPVLEAPEWSHTEYEPLGRTAWAFIAGGTEGTDYQLRWTVADNVGHVWQRTGLLLCAQSS